MVIVDVPLPEMGPPPVDSPPRRRSGHLPAPAPLLEPLPPPEIGLPPEPDPPALVAVSEPPLAELAGPTALPAAPAALKAFPAPGAPGNCPAGAPPEPVSDELGPLSPPQPLTARINETA
jgi:hypothetical protein